MAGERAELERLRKLKRLRELEAKAGSAPQEPAPEASFADRLRDELSLSNLAQTAINPISRVPEQFGLAQEGLNIAGEKIAESPIANVSPELAAGLGTAVSIAPDIATSVGGGLGTSLGFKGAKLGREALKKAFGSKGIGEAIGEAERAAGVVKRLPTTQLLKEQLQLTGKGSFTDVANKVGELLNSGAKLPKQFLSDFRVAAKRALNTPAFSRGEPQALLLQVKNQADDAFNALVPGRAKLAKKFASAKSREQLLKSLGGAVKTGAKVAAGGTIAAGLLNTFR